VISRPLQGVGFGADVGVENTGDPGQFAVIGIGISRAQEDRPRGEPADAIAQTEIHARSWEFLVFEQGGGI
jgi:hypothetical protein